MARATNAPPQIDTLRALHERAIAEGDHATAANLFAVIGAMGGVL